MKIFITLLCFVVLIGMAQASPITSCPELIESFRTTGFSGAVLVTEHDNKICEGTLGTRYGKNSAPIELEDHFLIGSVSKQFTAVGLMLLVQQNKLKTDDSIDNYFPSFPNGDQITIKHLLTHTSGIPDFTSSPEFEKLKATLFTDISPLITLIKTFGSEFTPGAKFEYSNSNYVLLAAIIEIVSQKDWGSFTESELLKPAGMLNTKFATNKTEGLVFGNDFDRDYNLVQIPDSAYLERGWAHGAGGIESTVTDLVKWNKALYSGTLISNELITEMITPHVKVSNTMSYGFGLFRRFDFADEEVVFHSGGIPGFTSMNIYLPKRDISIIVLTNSSDATATNSMAWKIFELIRTGTTTSSSVNEIVLSPIELQEKIGLYNFSKIGLKVNVRLDGNSLYASINNEAEYRLIPVSQFKFYHRAFSLSFEFSEDLQKLYIKQGSKTYEGTK